MKRELNSDLSATEVYSTACSLLVILKNLCSKLHRQKGFNFIIILFKIKSRLRALGSGDLSVDHISRRNFLPSPPIQNPARTGDPSPGGSAGRVQARPES